MSVDLAALKELHLDRHGPSRLCMGPSVCSAVGYLAIIEQVLGERDAAKEVLRQIHQCRLNTGSGVICRACWLQAGRLSK